jgi:ABC-type multidrug transport system fused ATPase/permease subunit
MSPGSLRCPSCGAVVSRGPSARPAVCTFCASTLVETPAAEGRPERVVPFAFDERELRRRLRRWLHDQLLAPSAIQRAPFDDVRAVYVPFYAYDSVVRVGFSGQVGVTWTTGSGKHRRRHVRWFEDQRGSYLERVTDQLVSASRGLAEAVANRLEPFDLGAAVPWDPVLAPLVDLEEPSVPPTRAREIAQAELSQRGVAGVDRLVRGFATGGLTRSADLALEPTGLVVLPVWVVRLTTRAGPRTVYVNGQTGEVVADLPTSWVKVLGSMLGATGVMVVLGLLVVVVLIAVAVLFGVGLPVVAVLVVVVAEALGDLTRAFR